MIKLPNALSKIADQIPIARQRRKPLTTAEKIAKLKDEHGLFHGKGKRKGKGKKKKKK